MNRLQILMTVFSVLLIIGVIEIVRKEKISVKYSLMWLATGTAMLLMALLPNVFMSVARYIGFEVLSNMIFFASICLLMLISISLTVIVSGQKKKIQILAQEVSLLKQKIDSKEREEAQEELKV
ncbi:MAG: DUF2304 domain-containing protein [Oscillospiraceae bacterium]|nr:DUF2304 domain-containing protein [Oscillospiraceae bacterium]